jgi:uncharacterized membrane protein YeaQ/YmgE (transglycosylase-associated protein family)
MTDIAYWGPLVWITVLACGGVSGFILDLVIAQGKAPGGVLATMAAGFLGAFLTQWLIGEVIPWGVFGVNIVLVVPIGAMSALLYLVLTKLFHFY